MLGRIGNMGTPDQVMLARDLAREARELIERDGWVQGFYHVEGGGYCFVGALDARIEAHNLSRQNSTWDDEISDAVADIVFSETAKLVFLSSDDGLEGEIVSWNDAEGRSAEDVIGVLKAVEYNLDQRIPDDCSR